MPISAKEKQGKEEPNHVTNKRQVFVTSTTKLISFALVCITLLLVVEINIEITAMVTIVALGITLLTMLMQSVFNINEA